MNEGINKILHEIMETELKPGTKISVEVDEVLGKDIFSLRGDVKGDNYAITKMLVSEMTQNKDVRDIIRWAAMVSYMVRVDAVAIPRLNKDEEGGSHE